MVAQSTNERWLSRVKEEALEPEIPICDPHHHLWDFRRGGVQERYLLDEILDDVAGGHNIVSTVFIECGAMFKADGPEAYRCVGETEFVNFWHTSPDIQNHRTDPPEGLLLQADFRAGFKHLAPRKLTFEVWCAHTQIPDAVSLARAFPDTTLVLDHFGGPIGIGRYAGKQDEVFATWKTEIDELARCPNVVAKLGGLNMEVNGYGWERRALPPTSTELAQATRRYFEHTIERFGANRCMFESNFPVDKLSCSYTVLWNSFKRLSKGYSADERAALFHGTAARVYRL
jgi:predicted TIM-barrel fold metal-dependent hydrolase